LVEARLLEPNDRVLRRNPAEYDEYNAKRRARAAAVWNSRFIEPITPERTAGKYLRARGLEAFIGHPALRCLANQLVARVWHVNFGFSGIQRTWLLIDGSDRDRDQLRITEGALQGGAVWIGVPRPDEWCAVAEGLETLLSAMLLLDLRCGAAVLGPNLKSLVLPKTARRLHIAADNDETGRGAAAHTAKLWCARDLSVRISTPDKEGADFNDVLLEGIR
jgi:hypothetical protein